jgi:hypothetical protein
LGRNCGDTTCALRVAVVFGLMTLSLLAAASPAWAVSGAAYTTVDEAVDGPGHCANGNPNVNCNLYDGKQYVWLNGGPIANGLGPNGAYFFAVLVPGGQNNPNDGAAKNLSDDYDTYANRTFTIANGEVSAYVGTHSYDPAGDKIRLLPYSNTANNGGVYILAICSLDRGYPVVPRTCKYDAFKVGPDTQPPVCPPPALGFNNDGERTATQLFSDAGGIDSISVVSITNATWTLQNFFQGTAGTVKLIATKINQSSSSTVRIVVTDVAGYQTSCDPVFTQLRVRADRRSVTRIFRGLSEAEYRVAIKNSVSRPLNRVAVIVNGVKFPIRGLRTGEKRVINVRSALMVGDQNTFIVRGFGPPRARAWLTISN